MTDLNNNIKHVITKSRRFERRMVMIVKRVGLECLIDAASLFNEFREFYEQEAKPKEAENFIRERMEKDESIIFLAYEGEKAIGFTQIYPIFSSLSMKRAYVLNDLFVTPAYRGLGFGKALLESVYHSCRTENISFVMLQTAPDNHKAKGLYEHTGMKLDSEYEWYIKNFG